MKQLWLLLCLVLLLSGCGAVEKHFAADPAKDPVPHNPGSPRSNGTTPGAARGVYFGSYSFGLSFYAIVLPDDTYYAIDGDTEDGAMVRVWVLRTGPGRSDDGKYTAALTHYAWEYVFSSSLDAEYVPATSLAGTVRVLQNGATHTFSATALPATVLNFDTPADPSRLPGTWRAWGVCDVLVGGAEGGCEPFAATVGANGEFSVEGSDCIHATITPDASHNYFRLSGVTLPLGAGVCSPAETAGTGIAVAMVLPNGTQQLLLAAVVDGKQVVFAAQR